MSKYRTVKPEFWSDEDVVECSLQARLLFIGLWNFCDDFGIFEWKPRTLKMKIFPDDDVDTSGTLCELFERGLVEKFEHCGKLFGHVRNFSRHQKIDPRFSTSILIHYTSEKKFNEAKIAYEKAKKEVLTIVKNSLHTSSTQREPSVDTSSARGGSVVKCSVVKCIDKKNLTSLNSKNDDLKIFSEEEIQEAQEIADKLNDQKSLVSYCWIARKVPKTVRNLAIIATKELEAKKKGAYFQASMMNWAKKENVSIYPKKTGKEALKDSS